MLAVASTTAMAQVITLGQVPDTATAKVQAQAKALAAAVIGAHEATQLPKAPTHVQWARIPVRRQGRPNLLQKQHPKFA
ncbi:hypothetical protein D8674_013181 [Pyrus ussuriensis x Pyrus communis]|uniref:Uncharacterized protein n=1 Tax=Pyrus ussuriensis x Pyrus communis TaxID=2448454 RepID=A0A5N5GUF5_9ROSA|nr:hypothetical protein D8674_013181 [Pyrus ussuriensis x Pyrus communis]